MNKKVIYEKRINIIIWLTGFLALNIAVYFLFTYPEYKKVKNADDQLEMVMRKKTDLQTQLNGRREVLKTVKENKSGISEFRKNVLSEKKERMTALQREIRKISEEAGIKIETITYNTKGEKKSELVYFSIGLPLQGTYKSVRKFISAVESSSYFLIIENIGLKIGNETSQELTFEIKMGTYFKYAFTPGRE